MSRTIAHMPFWVVEQQRTTADHPCNKEPWPHEYHRYFNDRHSYYRELCDELLRSSRSKKRAKLNTIRRSYNSGKDVEDYDEEESLGYNHRHNALRYPL